MFKKIIFFILVGAMSIINVQAINKDLHEISGTIKDSNTNLPIEGINILNETSGAFTYSDVSGFYKLDDISTGDVISFFGLGYEKKQITIDQNGLDKTLDITLKESPLSLEQILLVSRERENALTTLVNIDIENSPVKSAQEILRKVPGLIIGQHAGGGKAEQLFLRGFDVDHGTDVAIDVDGLPVNLPSHAHGQGYSDLHFLIPETINNIDFGKGPYYADKGNFNTAGYVSLQTKKTIDENQLSLEIGQFNTLRTVGLFKVIESDYSNAYVASEILLTDGVFESPQNFNRINVLGRYNYNNYEDTEFTVSLSHFQSRWNASGQIPQRAVDQGLIGRFGALDDTEGGITGRSNIWVNHRKQLSEHEELKSKAFVSLYDFELYSNFTFFLNDPVNGDQIRQRERRTIIGAETVYNRTFDLNNADNRLRFNAGIGFRYDDVNDVELSRTRNRQELLSRLAFGDVDEVNGYLFADASYKTGKWRFVPGVRVDYFKFGYNNFISGLATDPAGPNIFDDRQVDDVIVSPKFNTTFTLNNNAQFFFKSGFGFHSNDSRVVTNPQGLLAENIQDSQGSDTLDTLPSAFGVDIGAIVKPIDRLVLNGTLWGLALEQEFVFVGDESVVEPSGRSRRYGVEFGARYQFNNWLYGNFDINYTLARSIDEPNGQDFIPLAPDLTSTGGLSVQNLGKFSGGINYRLIDDRPANEDNSIVAEGYFVTDLNVNYNFAKNWSLSLIIENLFDTEWNETQFATETLIRDANGNLENESVEEITFTPGTPFSARFRLSVRF